MSKFEEFVVALPPELARLVRAALEEGLFATEDDVFIDAMEDWRVKQTIRAEKLQRLRELIEQGIASGSEPMAEDEFEQIKQDGRVRLAASKVAE